ncbi:methyltransferase domain-containing protein [bacterium]|nr:methyltransferase domain-containing protein [bacterium]
MSRLTKELRQKSHEAFDRASKTYDCDFSLTAIGRDFRARVQKRLDALFKPGMLVLDIGCGTGDDAIHLAKRGISVIACDFSSGMLTEAEKKIKKAGFSRDVTLRHLRAEELLKLIEELPMGFDGVYSNFGPLNMIENLDGFARLNARLLNPGGKSLHVVMGRKPIFETIYFLLHRRFSRAFSRWRGSALVPMAGKRVPSRFYQPSEIADIFGLYFSIDRIEALGLMLPPPYLSGHFRRRRKFYRKFRWLDKNLSALPLFNTMGDHFIIEMTRERDLVSEVI